MKNVLFDYTAEGSLPGFLVIRRWPGDDLLITARSPAVQVDSGFRESGECAQIVLPASKIEALINALWNAGPH